MKMRVLYLFAMPRSILETSTKKPFIINEWEIFVSISFDIIVAWHENLENRIQFSQRRERKCGVHPHGWWLK